jgi:WD40 repeat protein
VVFRGHEGIVRALAFSDDERYLAMGSEDNTARLWAIGAPQSEPTLLRAYMGEVHTVAFSADNAMLVSTSSDGTALRWDLRGAVPQPTVMRKGAGFPPVMAVSPNNQWLATVEFSKTVELQKISASEKKPIIIGSAQSYPSMALFSPNSRLFAVGRSDGTHGTAQIWQINAPQSAPISVDSGGSGHVALAFSPPTHSCGRRAAAMVSFGSGGRISRLPR